MVIVVQVNGFLHVRSLVQDLLGRLGELLFLQVHLVVQVIRLGDASDFGNRIWRHAPGFNCDSPVVDVEFLLLLEEELQLLLLRVICARPLVVLDFDDLVERLVLRERSIEFSQVRLVVHEEFQETFHSSELFPPLVLL